MLLFVLSLCFIEVLCIIHSFNKLLLFFTHLVLRPFVLQNTTHNQASIHNSATLKSREQGSSVLSFSIIPSLKAFNRLVASSGSGSSGGSGWDGSSGSGGGGGSVASPSSNNTIQKHFAMKHFRIMQNCPRTPHMK